MHKHEKKRNCSRNIRTGVSDRQPSSPAWRVRTHTA